MQKLHGMERAAKTKEASRSQLEWVPDHGKIIVIIINNNNEKNNSQNE